LKLFDPALTPLVAFSRRFGSPPAAATRVTSQSPALTRSVKLDPGSGGTGNGNQRSSLRGCSELVAPSACYRRPMLRRSLESAQYLSIRYTERLLDADIEPSVGSVGDSYDNALAETINGLFKVEVIHGAVRKRSSSPPSNGSIGSTIVACSNRSEISRLLRPKRVTMPKPMSMLSRRDSNQRASGKPGAVQRAD
jgi:hypothetical protein